MTSYRCAILLLLGICARSSTAQVPDWNAIIGSAYTGARAYQILERLSDEAGGRLMGTEGNRRGIEILRNELRRIGLAPSLEPFAAPGWRRGEEKLEMTFPVRRTMRVAALGYTNPVPASEDSVVFAGHGFPEDYAGIRAEGRIVLVTSEGAPPAPRSPLLRSEAIEIAAARGARAILFINDKKGGLLLLGVGNFEGKPNAIPAFTLTFEEGTWIQRLLEEKKSVRIRFECRSQCETAESANLVARLAGRRPQKIVVGAHIDSWDISQGSTDNGIGSAVLFDVARLLAACSPKNEYTVEFVWFNGEELGLWGSKRYAEAHPSGEVAAMVNLDMIGSPVSFNAMGFDEALPVLRRIVQGLPGYALQEEIQSIPWTNSDHQPFLLRGIPSVGIGSRLDPADVRFYHDFGDTFDKVNRQSLSDAAAVTSVLIATLANEADLNFRHKTPDEIVAFYRAHKVDETLRREKEWPFGTAEGPP